MTNPVVEATKEAAIRQLNHLVKDIDYDYPAPAIRQSRIMANRAVSSYLNALDAQARARRERNS